MPIPSNPVSEAEREAQKILSALGPEFVSPEAAADNLDPTDLQGLLKVYRLDPKHILKEVREMMNDESPLIRMRGIELSVKLNGLLDKDSDVQGTTFTVILRPKNGQLDNPILLPRELKQDTNVHDTTNDPITSADADTGELIEPIYIDSSSRSSNDFDRLEASLPPILHSGEQP